MLNRGQLSNSLFYWDSNTTRVPGADTAYSLLYYPLLRMVAEPKIRSTDSSAHSHVLVIEFQDQICKSSSKRKGELNGQK
jgi:hypothetical protein